MDEAMMIETAELLEMTDLLPKAPDAFLRRYAPTVKTFNSKFVEVRKITGDRRLAPLVTPGTPGKPSKRVGKVSEVVEPAYLLDTKPLEPEEASERAYGEPIGGDGRTGGDRMAEAIAVELLESRNAWIRRLEWMAAYVLRDGKLVLKGDDYPETTVDYKRHTDLKIANLTGTNAWSHANSDPIKNFREWAEAVLFRGKSGGVTDVILGATAFGKFTNHAKVAQRFVAARPNGVELDPRVPIAEGLTYQGYCEGLNIFTYTGWFDDPANGGASTPLFPADAAAVTLPNWMVQAFGMIRDPKANYQAMPWFPKVFEENNPGGVVFQAASAPIIVPRNVNLAAVCGDIDA